MWVDIPFADIDTTSTFLIQNIGDIDIEFYYSAFVTFMISLRRIQMFLLTYLLTHIIHYRQQSSQ